MEICKVIVNHETRIDCPFTFVAKLYFSFSYDSGPLLIHIGHPKSFLVLKLVWYPNLRKKFLPRWWSIKINRRNPFYWIRDTFLGCHLTLTASFFHSPIHPLRPGSNTEINHTQWVHCANRVMPPATFESHLIKQGIWDLLVLFNQLYCVQTPLYSICCLSIIICLSYLNTNT